jgi:hypothetical protein
LREDFASNDIILLQLSEMSGEHLLRGIWNEPLKFAKSTSSIFEVKQNERFPFSADDFCSKVDGTIPAIHKDLRRHLVTKRCLLALLKL